MAAETLPQQLTDIGTQLTGISGQITKISPSTDAASLDALSQSVAQLQAGQTLILNFLGLDAPATQAQAIPTPPVADNVGGEVAAVS